MVKALDVVHALAWRVPIVKVPGVMKKGFIAIGLVSVVILIAALINKVHHQSVLIWVIATTLFVLVPSGVWLYLTCTQFPSAPGVTWRDLWIGAVMFGVGVEGLHVVTVIWISRSFSSKSETYGALGAALAILFWAYILGRLVTASASVSAVMWYKKHPLGSAPSGSAFLATASAAADLPAADPSAPSSSPPHVPASSPVVPLPPPPSRLASPASPMSSSPQLFGPPPEPTATVREPQSP